jgi:hypothetical protein
MAYEWMEENSVKKGTEVGVLLSLSRPHRENKRSETAERSKL